MVGATLAVALNSCGHLNPRPGRLPSPWPLALALVALNPFPSPGRQSPILAGTFPGMAHVGLILDQREDIVAFETLAALKEG
jgi:hypothetical protein